MYGSYINVAALQAHVVNVIDNALLELDPFPHIYVSKLLPEEVYQHVLAAMPPDGMYRVQMTEFDKRKEIDLLNDPRLAQLPWMPLCLALTSANFKKAVFEKLACGIAKRFKITEPEAVSMPCDYSVRLFRDSEGYEIPPHHDTLKKIVMMQLYLPCDYSQLQYGTSLLRDTDDVAFQTVKTFPFAPNSAYAFPVSCGPEWPSWHMRAEVKGLKAPRDSLAVVFRQKLGR